MPIWEWTVEYKSRRVMEVEADTEEEAREKMNSGDWLSEHEIDLHAVNLVKDLRRTEG